MATLVPEFISVLRDIRDIKYPDIIVKHGEVAVNTGLTLGYKDTALTYKNEASVSASSALANKVITDANVVITNNDKATTNANAVTCTEKAVIASQILAMTASASTLVAGSPASASFNPTTGIMSFGIPAGPKGDKGDAFVVNAIGTLAGRTAYDLQPINFTYYATDIGEIYFKLSATSGDWSIGSPFGKGDTGDTGNGIASITLIGSVANIDTYRILYTDATFFDFDVTNGSVTSVAGRTGDVTLTKTDVGLSNVDNTSDLLKPLSTAEINALALKANLASPALVNPTINGIAQSGYTGFKNYMINGGFDIWQRATSQTINGCGSDDRWHNTHLGSTKTHSQAVSGDTARGYFNAPYYSSTAVTSVAGAGNYVTKLQKIEDVTRLAGKTVTLSFWAKANSSKNVAIEFAQVFGYGGTPSSAVDSIGTTKVALTTTWTKYTHTVSIPSIVGKTLGTDGVDTSSTNLIFWFDAGSDYNARTDTLGQQSGTFYIAEVQVEEGSVATSFEDRPYGLELSLCQRYAFLFLRTSSNTQIATGYMSSTTAFRAASPLFHIKMRKSPTITFSGRFDVLRLNTYYEGTSVSIMYNTITTAIPTALVAGEGCVFVARGDLGECEILLTSEL